MRVLHVSPTWFGAGSIIGGGERFAFQLARAMAVREEVTFLTFARDAHVDRDGPLTIVRLPAGPLVGWHPLAAWPGRWSFLKWVRWADAVHAYQVATFTAAAAVTVGRALGKATFVTDLGGGHPYAPTSYLPLLPCADGFLLLSEYSQRLWSAAPRSRRAARLDVIYGGVDLDRFAPGGTREPGKVLFAGRLLPHKGIDYLIEAIEAPLSLTICGPAPDADYRARLHELAAGRPVRFAGPVEDDELSRQYQSAMVTVLPSVYETAQGRRSVVPELLGLVVLESMACGTPAIVTDVASLPELVEDGRTGFIVPPNDSAAIRDRLLYLHAHPETGERMGRLARERVLQRFTWPAVAERCLDAYRQAIAAHS